jgi:DNA-binding SARP family transcriptional activator
MIEIRLLGGFEIHQDGRPLPAQLLRRRRPTDLLKLIATSPRRALPREVAMEALWPGKDPESAANNLHRALHDLRQVFGSSPVVLEKGVVRLLEETRTDVEEFERCVASSEPNALTRAIALYRGPLCADDPYFEWLDPRRRELRQRFIDCAFKVARLAFTSGQDTAAIDVLRRLLALEPAEEEAHCLMMRALTRSGRRHDALRQYDVLVQALKDASDSQPAAESRALYERFARGELEGATASAPRGWSRLARRLLGTSSPPPIHGHEHALAAIDRLVEEKSGVLILSGESGSGKTRLAIEAARRLEGVASVLLAGAGSTANAALPFAPFDEAFFDHGRAVGRAIENPIAAFSAAGDPEQETMRLFRAVQSAIEELGGEASVFILIDDLQWVDDSSLALFHHLARTTRVQPLILVATCREEEIGPGLRSLLTSLQRERLAERVAIGGLSLEQTRAQMIDLLDEPPSDPMVRTVFELTSGNPLFTEEVVRSTIEAGQPLDGASLPDDLVDTIRARVERLGEDAIRLLRAASVLGSELTFRWVHATSELSQAAALVALEAAIGARLIEESETGYRFRHMLVRDALYGLMTKARRVQLHALAASVIEEEPESTKTAMMASLAQHHLAAEQKDRALPCLVAAGQHAMSRAGLREALEHFERALEVMRSLGMSPSPHEFEMLIGIGRLQIALGDLRGASANLAEAAELGDERWRPDVEQRATAWRFEAMARIVNGELDTAESILTASLTELSPSSAQRAEALYQLAQLRWHQERFTESFALAEESLAIAQQGSDPAAVGRAYEMLALAANALGRWRDGVHCLEQRKALIGVSQDVTGLFDVHL